METESLFLDAVAPRNRKLEGGGGEMRRMGEDRLASRKRNGNRKKSERGSWNPAATFYSTRGRKKGLTGKNGGLISGEKKTRSFHQRHVRTKVSPIEQKNIVPGSAESLAIGLRS